MAKLTKEEILAERYTLRELYGDKNYHKHIFSGDKFKYNFPSDCKEVRLVGGDKTYLEITITGVRSSVMFYTVEGHPEFEFYCGMRSPMAAFLEPQDVDVEWFNELKEFHDNIRNELNKVGYDGVSIL